MHFTSFFTSNSKESSSSLILIQKFNKLVFTVFVVSVVLLVKLYPSKHSVHLIVKIS